MALPIAIQLYSLREEMEKDFEGTLKYVSELGYDGVEFAGLYGRTAEEIKTLCAKYNLNPISAHVAIDEFICNGIENVVDTYFEIGCKFVVFPYAPEDRRPGGSRFDETIELIKKIGKYANEKGMKLLYHNHDFEFKTKIDGKYGLDVLYERVPAEYLASELDTCWVNVGGEDPASFIRKYTGRAPVVHLKDFYMTGALPQHLYALIGIDEGEVKEEKSTFEFRPNGHGMQNMPAILEAAKEAGAGWVVVEQDDPSAGTTPKECAKTSIEYLKSFAW